MMARSATYQAWCLIWPVRCCIPEFYCVAHLVSYLSQSMTLHPADVISTGALPGVGLGMKPPRYLQSGTAVELGISGLGWQRQAVVLDTSAT